MACYALYAPLIDAVWERLQARVAHYPPALQALAQRHFASINHGQYFSAPDAAPLLYLPMWAAPSLPTDTLLPILEAAALAYAYVRLQDNVLDEPGSASDADLLLLGNAYLWDAWQLWPTAPEFQKAARDAWLRFSAATMEERSQLSTDRPYAEADFVAHAAKVAMAEIPLYAALYQSGQWEKAGHVPALVHALGVAYGYFNDVRGYRRDIASHSRTFLLAQVPSDHPEQALRTGPFLEDALSTAMQWHERAIPHAEKIGMPPFLLYTTERLSRLRQLHQQLAYTRLAFAFGQ